MVRVDCQNGDGGGSWVGELLRLSLCLTCPGQPQKPCLTKSFEQMEPFCSDILFPYRSPSPPTPPRPHPTPRNGPETGPKQTRNGAKRSQTDPNGAKRSRNGLKSSPLGWDSRGGLSGWAGGGVVREKESHYPFSQNGWPHYQMGEPIRDPTLDGRNRAIVIAESLARVIAAIRIASVRWQSYLPRKHRN